MPAFPPRLAPDVYKPNDTNVVVLRLYDAASDPAGHVVEDKEEGTH